MKKTIDATHRHKHINATFQLLEICNNGSWKGLIVEGKRKPKTYFVQDAYKVQWETI